MADTHVIISFLASGDLLSADNHCKQLGPRSGMKPCHVGQSLLCVATAACLPADPGVTSLIPVRYHTFMEIDHEIISTVILFPSTELFKKGCCQIQAKVCARSTA